MKTLVTLVIIITSLYFACSGFIGTTIAKEVALHAKLSEKHLDSYLEDLHSVSRLTFFQASSRLKDAGEYLNSRIEWEPKRPQNSTPSIFLSRLQKKQILSWGPSWIEKSKEFETFKIDVFWLKSLLVYDHWDLGNSTVNQDFARNLSSKNLTLQQAMFEYALPKYSTFVALAKLRLLEGMTNNNLLPALQEVRQLARLIFSNHNLASALSSFAILKAENTAYERASVLNILSKNSWEAIDERTLSRAKRVVWATQSYLSLITPIQTIQTIYEQAPDSTIICPGLSEAISYSVLSSRFLEPHFPLETDFGDHYEMLDRVFKEFQTTCSLPNRETLWNLRNDLEYGYLGGDSLTDRIQVKIFPYIPYLRRVVGLTMTTLGSSIGLEKYERLP